MALQKQKRKPAATNLNRDTRNQKTNVEKCKQPKLSFFERGPEASDKTPTGYRRTGQLPSSFSGFGLE